MKRALPDYRPGDRVCSTVHGLYMGMPGTILKKAQVQYGAVTQWIIELDEGEMLLNLSSLQIKPMKQRR